MSKGRDAYTLLHIMKHPTYQRFLSLLNWFHMSTKINHNNEWPTFIQIVIIDEKVWQTSITITAIVNYSYIFFTLKV